MASTSLSHPATPFLCLIAALSRTFVFPSPRSFPQKESLRHKMAVVNLQCQVNRSRRVKVARFVGAGILPNSPHSNDDGLRTEEQSAWVAVPRTISFASSPSVRALPATNFPGLVGAHGRSWWICRTLTSLHFGTVRIDQDVLPLPYQGS